MTRLLALVALVATATACGGSRSPATSPAGSTAGALRCQTRAFQPGDQDVIQPSLGTGSSEPTGAVKSEPGRPLVIVVSSGGCLGRDTVTALRVLSPGHLQIRFEAPARNEVCSMSAFFFEVVSDWVTPNPAPAVDIAVG